MKKKAHRALLRFLRGQNVVLDDLLLALAEHSREAESEQQ